MTECTYDTPLGVLILLGRSVDSSTGKVHQAFWLEGDLDDETRTTMERAIRFHEDMHHASFLHEKTGTHITIAFSPDVNRNQLPDLVNEFINEVVARRERHASFKKTGPAVAEHSFVGAAGHYGDAS